MHFFKHFSRYFVGLLFLFSGFVKIVDPIGTGIKMEKYFLVFTENISPIFEIFIPYGLPFAIFIICLEVVLGFALLLNYKMKITAYSLLGLIIVFTLLTFYTAITGDPKDCGCFGDFLKLTPWQSFSKDIVLSVFIGIIFIYKNDFNPLLNPIKGDITLTVLTILTTVFAFYNIFNLPVIDFRPYAIGSDLKELMNNGEPAVIHYEFEKEGNRFTNPEAKMEYFKPPFKYIGTVTIKEEKAPSIVGFDLTDSNGINYTEEILTGKKLLILIKKSTSLNQKISDDIEFITDKAKEMQITPVIISSIGLNDFKSTPLGTKWTYSYYTLDTDISKAVIRSDIGLLLIEDGIVKNKKHAKNAKSILE